jgi:hypothetical protein
MSKIIQIFKKATVLTSWIVFIMLESSSLWPSGQIEWGALKWKFALNTLFYEQLHQSMTLEDWFLLSEWEQRWSIMQEIWKTKLIGRILSQDSIVKKLFEWLQCVLWVEWFKEPKMGWI